jgi:hypothetical protein
MSGGALSVLSRIRAGSADGRAPGPTPPVEERCELCAAPIETGHRHIVDVRARRLLCACRPCHLLFADRGAGGAHFRGVPDRYLAFPSFALAAGAWASLQIPVSVAFLFHTSAPDDAGMRAFYPSPAGATESLLPMEAWSDVLAANPALGTAEPDIEALLIRSAHGRPATCFLVPIDRCYELVGELRIRWRGFDGGREANEALDAFFVDIAGRAR